MPVLDEDVLVREDVDVALPPMYKITMFNDDDTGVDFVVETLMEVFGYTYSNALDITRMIDMTGSGVVATGLSKQIAVHLVNSVEARNKVNSYTLRCEYSPE